MNDKYKYFWNGFYVGLVLSMILFIIIIECQNGYKQGQIDALTNKIQYELTTNPDSTRTWKKIGE